MTARSYAAAATARILAYPDVPRLSLGPQRFVFKLLLLFADASAFVLAFVAGYWVRFDLRLTVAPEVTPAPGYYPHIVALLLPLFLAAMALFRLYETRELLGGVLEYSRAFRACTTAATIIIIASFAVPQFVVSRGWLVSAWLLSLAAVMIARFTCRRIGYALRGRGYLLTPAIIVGTNSEATALAVDLNEWRSSGVRIVGFIESDGHRGGRDRAPRPILGGVEEVRRVVAEHGVEEIIVAITALSRQQLLNLCEEVNPLQGVCLRLSSGLYEILTTGMRVRTMGSVPLVSLNKARLEPRQLMAKALVEYSVVLPALFVMAPLVLALALIVRLDSPGPAFYRRRVLGAGGRPFDAFKLRTMRVDGDDVVARQPELGRELRANHKLKQDPRVTRVGRWLRRYSLDELPQLFNVLLGQMSLVGPRMITEEEVEKYGLHKLNLLTVKPGITGLWQVSGRSDISYEERVQLDMYYIRNYSVWLDLQILFVQTIPAVIRARGAY